MFIYILINQLEKGMITVRDSWMFNLFFNLRANAWINKTHGTQSMEWNLISPPNFHALDVIPKQS